LVEPAGIEPALYP